MDLTNRNSSRLLSLDVFRGLTVALMILVNSPGNNTAYSWLSHSDWNGCTLADLVFPFFIFIVGISSVITLTRARANGKTPRQLFPSILKRTLILFITGLLLNAFPYHFDLASIRIYGVLQRIALCYFVSAGLFLSTRFSTQASLMMVFMLLYWLVMSHFPVPGFGVGDFSAGGNVAGYLDRMMLAPAHLYGKTGDPEGLLSTLPSFATVLLGNLVGAWLLSTRSHKQKITVMTIAGFFALLVGWLWGFWFPINKSLWTSSYVLWTGGFALIILTLCYWLIEVKAWHKWCKPLELFGLNAMLAYLLHVFFLKIQAIIPISRADGTYINLRLYTTEHFFHWTSAQNASLLYALSYTVLWLLVIWFFTPQNQLKPKEPVASLK